MSLCQDVEFLLHLKSPREPLCPQSSAPVIKIWSIFFLLSAHLEYHMHGLTQDIFLQVWLLLLYIILRRSTHVAFICSSFLKVLISIVLYEYATVHFAIFPLLRQLIATGCLSCLTGVCKGAGIIACYFCYRHVVFISLG